MTNPIGGETLRCINPEGPCICSPTHLLSPTNPQYSHKCTDSPVLSHIHQQKNLLLATKGCNSQRQQCRLSVILTLRFRMSHLLNLHIEFVVFWFVQTLQVPQLSFLLQPAQDPHLLLRMRFCFLAADVGESCGVIGAPAELSSLAPILTTPSSCAGVETGLCLGGEITSDSWGAGLVRWSSKRKTGGRENGDGPGVAGESLSLSTTVLGLAVA